MRARSPGEQLVTRPFVTLLAACSWYFLATGMMLEAIPRFVRTALEEQDWGVGAAMGSAGVAAALLRLPAGTLTDRKGRRWVLVLGSTTAGLSMLGLLAAHNIGAVVGFRLLTGLAEAAFFVAAATALGDLAPESRRGEATSYFSVVAYTGLALGPVLAEWLIKQYSFDVVWLVATGLSLLAGALSLRTPQNISPAPATAATTTTTGTAPDTNTTTTPGTTPDTTTANRFWPKPLLHPAARAPGVVLLIGLMGFASFVTFAALWATEVGIARAGDIFMLFAGSVLAVRLLTARLIDRFGARSTTTIALSASAAGLVILALWQSPAGAYVGSSVIAVGQGFMFPALFTLVIQSAPPAERGQAVGAFSMSFDLAFGLGGLVAGGVADGLGGIPAAFWFGAGACALALAVARALLPAAPNPARVSPPRPDTGQSKTTVSPPEPDEYRPPAPPTNPGEASRPEKYG